MTLPLPHSITPPTGGTYEGCAYWRDHDKLLVANQGDGKIYALSGISKTSTIPKPVAVVGTGYNTPSDIMLSADGSHAYIAERSGGGNLLRVPLSNLNRAAATVVAGSLGGGSITQIGLDETHGLAFVVVAGNLLRIKLSGGGAPSTVATGLGPNTDGVLASKDGRFVYVSHDDKIVKCDLTTSSTTVVAAGINNAQQMVWLDAGETAILFTEWGATTGGNVRKLDLTTASPLVSDVAGPCGIHAYSLAICSPEHLLITCGREVDEVFLTPYASSGPLLLGIGFVPVDTLHIVNGYATTTMDPAYFFQVRDAPFGGTLPIMINFDLARSSGAKYYKVLAGPVGLETASEQPYSDYRWNTALDRFELVTTTPAGGFYPVRAAGEIWLNYWLGMLLSTAGSQPNGLVSIIIELYDAKKGKILSIPVNKRSVTLMIDNTGPSVGFYQISQVVTPPPSMTTKPVKTCDVVMSGHPWFTFTITAQQAQQHLAGWSLVAYWGENKSATVAGDSYSNHISPSRLWAGITMPTAVPPPPALPNPWWDATVAGDPTSTHCAHTFFLYAWDRVINGWGYIHGWDSYSKSITIWL
ncbi:MAG: hypothetical protein WCB46_12585 [Methanoregula sp.]